MREADCAVQSGLGYTVAVSEATRKFWLIIAFAASRPTAKSSGSAPCGSAGNGSGIERLSTLVTIAIGSPT